MRLHLRCGLQRPGACNCTRETAHREVTNVALAGYALLGWDLRGVTRCRQFGGPARSGTGGGPDPISMFETPKKELMMWSRLTGISFDSVTLPPDSATRPGGQPTAPSTNKLNANSGSYPKLSAICLRPFCNAN